MKQYGSILASKSEAYTSRVKKTLTEEVESHFRAAQRKGVRKHKLSRWKHSLWRDKEGFLVE
jgi:hypothetical protein